MNRLVSSGRVAAMIAIMSTILIIYMYFLYDLQIIQGEEYYSLSERITSEETVITAARGNILDRYGRVLVSNKECYNLKVDNVKIILVILRLPGTAEKHIPVGHRTGGTVFDAVYDRLVHIFSKVL